MYQPPLFREDRVDVMQALMRAHPFATLVSSATGTLSADHVPLVLDATGSDLGVLRGHLAAANPLARQTEGPIEVMTIFQGAQTYVTPAWYASKQEHGRVVPTWNYAVVHARGTLNFVSDPDWLLQHLQDLTAQHEATRAAPWAVSDAPEDFVALQLRALIGFEIRIASLEGKWKASQNKNAADRQGVRAGLAAEDNADARAMADLVARRSER